MEIYIGSGTSLNYSPDLKLNVLESFFAIRKKDLKIDKNFVKKFFLDSGAFSAYTQKKYINLDSYIDYIKRHSNIIDYYANLDEIYNAEKSAENLAKMEAEGLKPIPVYHYGEKFDIFKKMVEKYNHIALGGMVPISTQNLIPWLDDCFEYICKDGKTEKKIHGFGMTTLSLMKRYPWFSVDSISPILTAAMGGIYNEQGQVVSVARKKHIPLITKLSLGDIGTESWIPLTNIKQNPFIGNFSYDEIRYKYKIRIIINLRYIMNLEKELTENSPVFNNCQKRLLFL